MNKKLVTLFSVVIFKFGNDDFADTLSLGGDSKVVNDTSSNCSDSADRNKTDGGETKGRQVVNGCDWW